jgi:hypothetical protein
MLARADGLSMALRNMLDVGNQLWERSMSGADKTLLR